MSSNKWLLARPRGGLNDTLCQMEKCWRFAEKTGRQLVFDTKDSGLLMDFHEVFSVRSDRNTVMPHLLTEELIKELNQLSAFPREIQGRVTEYEKIKNGHDDFFTLQSATALKFPLTTDFPEEVVVYEAMGGGVDSFCTLERIVLQPWLASSIIIALKGLPNRYISVHVRHSDMQTDYQGLFAHVKRRNVDKLPVFIASDNDAVVDDARSILGSDTCFTLAKVSERKGNPLHDASPNLSDADRRIRTVEALSELFALCGADQFFYTEVTNRTGVSGFSRLAAYLARNPCLRRALLDIETDADEHRECQPVLVAPLHRRLLETVRWRSSNCARSNVNR